MEIKEGDILQKGLIFYRVYSATAKDIVMNKILYNPKTERLQIYHGYDYASWDQVGDGKIYTILKSENQDTLAKLELVKRKYKLQKLNNINENDDISST